MIAYVTLGADDMERAEMFYSAFLPTLGYRQEKHHGELSYALPKRTDKASIPVELYIKSPFDGDVASSGNGTMIAFRANNVQQVRDLHAAAIAAGGSDEGQPGFRKAYGPHFYVGYLRDPQGNKIALFSNKYDEPKRVG